MISILYKLMSGIILKELVDRVSDLESKYLKLSKSIKKKDHNNESLLSIFNNLDIKPKKKNNKNINNNNIITDDSDDDINYDININDIICKQNTNINTNEKNSNNLVIKKIINKNQIDCLDDFIKINDYYQKNKLVYKFNKKYDIINLQKIEKIIKPIIKLKKMVGLNKIKGEIINFILYYLIYDKNNDKLNRLSQMKHISIEGSPGCGKTKLAKIISKILISLGILENKNIVYAKRTDLIGTHLGHTGKKTQNVINKALGGVLFIDEAYSLGCNDKEDIFSKECIDIITQNLSDNKSNFVCIIAGYTEELETNFFSVNPGLIRRFPFRFKIEKYTYQELKDIFIRKIYKLNWKINTDIDSINKLFENNYKYFKYFGGDIDTFIQDIKYSHTRRIACSNINQLKIINIDDITNAMDNFINRRTSNENNNYEKMYI